MQFSKEQMLKMYEYLVYSRIMAEKIVEFIYGGRIQGAIHPSLGQEAVNAGILMAQDITTHDLWTHCTHRQQPIISKMLGEDPFLGELMNKKTGRLGGISGEYHLCSMKDNFLPMQGILGAGFVTSAGFAWALKSDGKTDSVVLASIGDGAFSEGYVTEGMNLASLHKVPILFVVENNGVAMTTPNEEEAPIDDLYLRAASSGMKGATVDGNDVEAVAEALLQGLDLAVKYEPNLIELKTWRWQGHFVGDDQTQYRSTEFLENTDPIDPVKRYEKTLKERGVADDDYFKKTYDEQKKLLDDAFERALQQEMPTKEDTLVYDKVYASEAGGKI